MYSTCIFCHSDLGKNESIDHFPIGRRLAFDDARGRLWVVCRKCERWNLTPIEERWEAIEECERLFRGAKLRVSTDQIGLAKLREGLELVRVGQPQRPEMAAWRYGDQFGRRRRRYAMYMGATIVVAGGLFAGQITGTFVAGGALLNLFSVTNGLYEQRRTRVRLSLPGRAQPVMFRAEDIRKAWIEPRDRGWALNISHQAAPSSPLMTATKTSFRLVNANKVFDETLTGDDAMRALAKVLPSINNRGASRPQVESAIDLLENAGDRDELLRRSILPPSIKTASRKSNPNLQLGSLPRETLLALEMATHEESERRALEGELGILEEMWRQAEEIAAISDDMFVSDETRARLSSMKDSKDE